MEGLDRHYNTKRISARAKVFELASLLQPFVPSDAGDLVSALDIIHRFLVSSSDSRTAWKRLDRAGVDFWGGGAGTRLDDDAPVACRLSPPRSNFKCRTSRSVSDSCPPSLTLKSAAHLSPAHMPPTGPQRRLRTLATLAVGALAFAPLAAASPTHTSEKRLTETDGYYDPSTNGGSWLTVSLSSCMRRAPVPRLKTRSPPLRSPLRDAFATPARDRHLP